MKVLEVEEGVVHCGVFHENEHEDTLLKKILLEGVVLLCEDFIQIIIIIIIILFDVYDDDYKYDFRISRLGSALRIRRLLLIVGLPLLLLLLLLLLLPLLLPLLLQKKVETIPPL
jgi:hypothetical protein